ncbi:MAG TPA: copper chaperone PCu(A)C [Chloroflexi bacterium]|nr:copper chaperone PCu(A)C [Chloroflexota bacterium]
MKRLLIAILLAFLVGLLAGCGGSEKGIVIEDAWVRPSPMTAGNGAAYMVIRNTGSEDDALIAADSDIAGAVEIHETMMMEGDMMGMQPVESIPVPAGGSVTLEPGGYHIMLIDMREPLEAGQTVMLTLTFEKAGPIEVQAEVREQ